MIKQMETSEFMVEVSNLTKIYPGNIKAVDDITFQVRPGEFFGFLGPNGAGKTTTMKILGTLVRKTSGVAKVLGVDVEEDPNFVRGSIGFALQEISLDQLATGRETLILMGALYHMEPTYAKARANELSELFGLADAGNRKVGSYSGGMKRRLDLASVLMHKPRLLFLDEPTEGLDPQSRKVIWEYLANLNRDGVTIFLTTHYMEEADQLCSRLAIIDQGKIVAQDSPLDLKKGLGADVVNLKFGEKTGKMQIGDAGRILASVEDVREVKIADNTLSVYVVGASSKIPELFDVLGRHGIKVESISVSGPTLNDVFIKYTGHQIREEEARSSVDPMIAMWMRGGTRR